MYNITTTTWTMKRLLKEFGNINFRCPVQRGFVWDIGRQSLFVHSLLNGDIIPPLFYGGYLWRITSIKWKPGTVSRGVQPFIVS